MSTLEVIESIKHYTKHYKLLVYPYTKPYTSNRSTILVSKPI